MDMSVAPMERNEGLAERPWTLPEGWCWDELQEVALINPPTTFEELDSSAEITFIPMTAVSEESGQIDISNRRRISEVTKGYVRFMEGDVIFAKITPCMENGKVAPVIGLPEMYAAGSTEFHVLRPRAVDQRYIWYWLVSRRFRGHAQRNMSGSAGQLRVPVKYLRESAVPLAPLPEQRRIVARVDALFAQIAEGEIALAEARKGLETFRRALLKAAVTGELTKDWREKNRPTETGHDLLARIKTERAAQDPNGGRRKRSQDAALLDTSSLPEIPEDWAWATVSDVGGVQLGRQRAPQHHSGDHMRPYLRVANVFEDRIDLTDVKEMNFTPSELETFELHPGDILLNEGQTPDLLGRPAMWRSETKGYCFQNTLLRFRAHIPMNAEFCLLVFRHYLHGKRFKRESQITTNIAHLSRGRFSMIEFPVPPLKEQQEIVRLVSETLAGAVDTVALLETEAADAARLKQAILKAAFEGSLVEQDPNDESASALLARLRAEQSQSKPSRRGRSAKPASGNA